MDGPQVIDRRQNRDNTLGPAAKVSTSTLKPRNLDKPKPTPAERPKAPAGAPMPFGQSAAPRKRNRDLFPAFAGDDNAWCADCGGALFVSPQGLVCDRGHGEPPRVGWEAAAQLLYDAGKGIPEAAETMIAAEEDLRSFFAELDARAPVNALSAEDKASIAAAVANGKTIDQIATLFPRTPRPVLEALVTSPAVGPQTPPPVEPAAPAPTGEKPKRRTRRTTAAPESKHPHLEAMERSANAGADELERKEAEEKKPVSPSPEAQAIAAFKKGASFAEVAGSIIGSVLDKALLEKLFDEHGTGLRTPAAQSFAAEELTSTVEKIPVQPVDAMKAVAESAGLDPKKFGFAPPDPDRPVARTIETQPGPHTEPVERLFRRVATLETLLLKLAVEGRLSVDEVEDLFALRNQGDFGIA